MSQPTSEDLEKGDNSDSDPGPWPLPTQLEPIQPPKPSGEASNFGDSSGPLFSIYSKAAEDEDNKMVERWQKDADGILIFTGLFSAAVATLLSVTVQDLRPNSQDTSSFYLGNIYQVLTDPNVTRSSYPSPVAKPPPFSPPRYTIWVNSLWFLSLVMSLSCALLATSLHQWARRYLRLTRPSQCRPEKRARMRAFYANGVDEMHVPWAVEGLPSLLHLSVFFFFGGLVIFLFNNDYEVFSYVIWWIGLFSVVYGLVTLLPFIRHDSPYNSPLSTPAWFLYTGMLYVTFKGLIFMKAGRHLTMERYLNLRNRYPHYFNLRGRYRRWMFGGVEKAAEETVLERSSEIDMRILDWTVSTLGDDNSLGNFFESIPGFFDSKMSDHLQKDIPQTLSVKFLNALHGFWERAWSSNSISVSEKARRLDISLNAMSRTHDDGVWSILYDILICHLDEVPLTVEMGHTLAGWCTSNNQDIADCARSIVTTILVLANAEERNDSWLTLATRAFGPLESDVRDSITVGGDSVLLDILIEVARQSIPRGPRSPFFLRSQHSLAALIKLDIRNTLPRLQHEFCTLWNVIVLNARTSHPHNIPVQILKLIRRHYLALHQGTDAAPTAFSVSTPPTDAILFERSSYPFCNLASHCSNLTFQILSQPGDSPDAHNQVDITAFLHGLTSNPTTVTTSQVPNTTPLANSVHPTGDVAPATQDSTSTATLTHPLEGNEQQDAVAQCGEPDASRILFTVSVPAPAPTLATVTPPVLVTTSAPHDAGAATSSGSLLSTPSVVGLTVTPCHPPPHVPPMPSPRPVALLSATSPSRLTSGLSLSHLRPRGLVNGGNMCFANAVLQLLVHSPPSWNLFRELCELKEQRGALECPETGGGATPLVDATMRFFEEFTFNENESHSTQQPLQPSPGGISREGEEKEKDNSVVDSFEPTYLYDAMKESRQLKNLLDGQVQDAKEFLDLYLQALDEELSQLDHTEGRRRDFVTNFDGSPITHIFSGKFRSTVCVPNQPDVVSIENWRSLQLDIQPDLVDTIQDALACISQPQFVQGGPSGLGEASHQVLIEALPPILVLHLKRFRYDAAAGGVIKIEKPIQFAPELEIPLDIMVPNAQRPSESPHYKLYAVLYHHGESAGSGHYTIDILHPNRDGGSGEAWLHFDDEVVSAVHHKDVFGGKGNERAAVEPCAYLLFYCRIPTET